ncbi:MAG: hypothetical protein ACRBEQ_09855 [Hyphomonas sp.]
MMKFVTLCAAGAVLALGASAELVASQEVERVIVTTEEDGSLTEELVPAVTVVPGEMLAYSLNWENVDAEPAENAVFTVPVPAEVTYIEGSAEAADAVVTFSADNGKTFFTRDKLVVTAADSAVSAQARDITHVRWTYVEKVAGKTSGTLTYKAVLK